MAHDSVSRVGWELRRYQKMLPATYGMSRLTTVAREFEVQTERSELGHGFDGAHKRVSCVCKEGSRASPQSADALAARDHTQERKKGRVEGREKDGMARALRLTRIVVLRSITGS